MVCIKAAIKTLYLRRQTIEELKKTSCCKSWRTDGVVGLILDSGPCRDRGPGGVQYSCTVLSCTGQFSCLSDFNKESDTTSILHRTKYRRFSDFTLKTYEVIVI